MYIIVIDVTKLSIGVKQYALTLLDESENVRYSSYRHSIDADLFLFGRFLTRQLISHFTKRTLNTVTIRSDSIADKPYDVTGETEFSISHSGNYVAVAVGDEPVGIDIQVHDQDDIQMFNPFFTKEERVYVGSDTGRFYRAWTAIESLAKITGLGFNESLKGRIIYNNGFEIDKYMLGNDIVYISCLLADDQFTLGISNYKEPVVTDLPFGCIKKALNNIDESAIIYSGKILSEV